MALNSCKVCYPFYHIVYGQRFFKLISLSRIDIFLFDNFRHFARERIPERILHAKGAGAHGYFLPTKDLSQYTIAAPFQPENLNKKIFATARFSTVNGRAGSADTVRTFRGFAVKLKTEVGNWDWGVKFSFCHPLFGLHLF